MAAQGRVLVVTGASRGIGAAVARQAGAAGWHVAVHFAGQAVAADKVVADIRAAGGTAAAFQAEIADPAEVASLFAAVDRTLGPLGGLVNNAGIIGGRFPVLEPEAGALERVLAVNVAGTYHAMTEAARRMATSRGGAGGAIVNLSSIVSRTGGLPQETHYAASKGAVDSLTLGLARELAPEGIRVNAVRPGIIATDIHDVHGGAEFLAGFGPQIPAGRPGTPDEVASTVLWLLSDAAAYVTGALFDVGGGR
ncbi:NAD(P)-dependent dehydrogenase (short-subunit alcohol dehydrogenase family) [Stella humosa]|uniref:NAD(P)-dependent dehydrogenase (Short-subunit alcohol dehydrogenase family) n=1 Tax=Stella humosa TaxID=94 RepID=A0A3N1KQ16_9PROT|nr:SDR family oxidoreductase [Stella humosa]ROP83883.1 NAD(P)-dependent dehydrogenase (short-subunit alcohol dehydrogenase family) [Stella humosa]BBK32855.1 glucose-1-dehydrogenase [Stella humosa]